MCHRSYIAGNKILWPIHFHCRLRHHSVLHASARLIYRMNRSEHITDALISLHWLRVPERVQFKIAMLTYKALHCTAPRYLGPLDRVAELPGRRALRSASSSRLVVPTLRLSTVGSRSFNVSAPRIWNRLPEDITSAPSLSTFRRRLKTHLFQQSYPDVVVH